MPDSRMTSLALMAVSTAAFVGTTSNSLPSETFFPALALFGIGAFKFMKSNHVALEKAEDRAHRAVNPHIRENRHAQAHAQRQAMRQGSALTHSGHSDPDDRNANSVASADPARSSNDSPRDEIEIENHDSVFIVDTDVSFPVEIQNGDALADQLLKLNQLLAQGVLTEEEYAVAKTKLLS